MKKNNVPKYKEEKNCSQGKILPFDKREESQQNDTDKIAIQHYQKKLREMIGQNENAKKAALILENLLKKSQK